jgi:hypothetical protein
MIRKISSGVCFAVSSLSPDDRLENPGLPVADCSKIRTCSCRIFGKPDPAHTGCSGTRAGILTIVRKTQTVSLFTKKGDKTQAFNHQISLVTYYEIEILLTLGECILWAKSAWLQALSMVRTSAN